MSPMRLVLCVLLPFASGYFLSYLFRTINAVIATELTAEFDLGAADLGLLTSVYFLVFTAAQLPLGVLLDRLGPSRVQSILMLCTCLGALVFAIADGFVLLAIGRALIGLGVAVALMAGIKAITLWFPPERISLATGWMVMLGMLGALAATGPAELVVQTIGWRSLFAGLALLSALVAFLLLLVPEAAVIGTSPASRTLPAFRVIYSDRRFWRIAPLSALGIGASWSLQGLWAAPWLHDVEGLARTSVVQHLGLMAIGGSCAAVLLGMSGHFLRRLGFKSENLLIGILSISLLAQALLVLRWPVPSWLPWMMIAAAGSATVLSFALMAEYFPKAWSGRANAALNLLHLGSAFVLQAATGGILDLWPTIDGAHPIDAHQSAMMLTLGLQLAGLAWFVVSDAHQAPSMSLTAAVKLNSFASVSR